VNATKKEKQSPGLITIAPASKSSAPNMSDGNEPDDILLAVMWSVLATLINRNKALLATADYKGQPATVVILVGTLPTDKGIEPVGTANQPLKVPTGKN